MWDGVGVPGVVFVLLLFGAPTVLLFVRSLTDPSPQNYVDVFTRGVYVESLIRTFVTAGVVALGCLVIGFPYAYYMARARRGIASLLLGLVLFSMWSSILVRTYALTVLLQDSGLINQFLMWTGVIDSPIHLMRNSLGVYIGMINVLLPYAILPLYAHLKSLDSELAPAASGLGATAFQAFVRITLPLARPGIYAAFILVFVISLGFFITPAMLGGPSDILVSELVVQQVESFLNLGMGSALALVLLAATLILLAASSRAVRVRDMWGSHGQD